jgi:ABC-type multidrug transport system fused ATPase/permease subunit
MIYSPTKRLTFIPIAFITFAVAFFVGRYGATISSGLGGLVLSYSQSITSQLNWLVRNTVDMENNMNSIERTDEYSSVEVEPFELDEAETAEPPRPSWPEAGHISFTSVFIKYRKDTDPVLKEISIDINGGEKVGVCGRTGAGKSTVMLTLFRLVECHSGKVTIDGIDIRTVSLFVLRSRIAIIPQV